MKLNRILIPCTQMAVYLFVVSGALAQVTPSMSVTLLRSGKTYALSPRDTCLTVSPLASDSVLIKLVEQPGTGYSWVAEPTDTTAVNLLRSWQISTRIPKKVGQSVTRCFLFSVQLLGKEKVIFRYRRVWEPVRNTDRKFILMLNSK